MNTCKFNTPHKINTWQLIGTSTANRLELSLFDCFTRNGFILVKKLKCRTKNSSWHHHRHTRTFNVFIQLSTRYEWIPCTTMCIKCCSSFTFMYIAVYIIRPKHTDMCLPKHKPQLIFCFRHFFNNTSKPFDNPHHFYTLFWLWPTNIEVISRTKSMHKWIYTYGVDVSHKCVM